MSDNDKNTCPVCFTRMRKINKVLTCPECGYKYCDYNRDREDMFDTSHTHATNYTTYSNNTASNTASSPSSYNPNLTNTYSNSGKTTYTQTTATSRTTTGRTTTKNKSVGKVVKIIVIIYLISMFCPFICGIVGMLFTAGIDLFEAGNNDYATPEIEISSELSALGIDGSAPIELDADDDDFLPLFIEHVFEVSNWQDVTNGEISNIYFLDINYDSEGRLYAYYFSSDYGSGEFTSKISELDTEDLNAFIGLKTLSTPEIAYSAGDLDNLNLLASLACKNTPAEVTEIVSDPAQLTELCLTIPSGTDSLAELEQFASLETLDITCSDSYITGAKQIAELPTLRYLTYYDNYQLQNYDFLKELPNVIFLCLDSTNLEDLSFVENMPELRTLTFRDTPEVTDLKPLSAVADTLTTLDISYNYKITDFSPLGELTALESLSMSSCDATDISFASNLENLEYLMIGNNQITSLEPLAGLSNLEYVSTSGNPIEDYAGLEDLTN